MRKVLFLVALGSAVLLTYGRALAEHTGASLTACCDSVPCTVGGSPTKCTNPNGGWACNEQAAFPSQPGASGCQESNLGCLGGKSSGGVVGCACVGPACLSGPIPPAVPPVIGNTPAQCTATAVAACRAAVPSGAHCTFDGSDTDTDLDDCAP